MLFNNIIYGPLHSRRLGTSLGINLMPTQAKLCTFNCIYCECGWNAPVSHPHLPTCSEFTTALEEKLSTINQSTNQPINQSTNPPSPLDVITFSGNGEPTLHPKFLQIMKETVRLRDQYCPTAKISVLSNSTQLGRPDVVEALKLADNRILKLDSAIDATMHLIDQPTNRDLTVRQITDWLKQFNGDFILQTCFLRGTLAAKESPDGQPHTVDNTTPEELNAWYSVVDELRPKQVMIYVIDRATPCQTLHKIDPATMNAIADHLRQRGLSVLVSA